MAGLIAALCLGGVSGAVSSLPLGWVTGDSLTLADPDAVATGTVWDGALTHIDGLPPILTGIDGRRLNVSADGPTLTMQAQVSPQSVSDLTLALPIASLSRFDPRLAGLAGTVRLRIDELSLSDARCISASGTAATDLLALNAARWNWQGPELSGPVTCEEGQVVISMSGANAGNAANVRVAISPTGPYRTNAELTTPDPNAELVLPLFGFERSGNDRWRISESGAWR